MTLRTVAERAKAALNDEFLRNAVKYTTEKLRSGKNMAANELGNWEEWRERGRQIRLHTIAHLDFYLRQFIDNARKQGVHVHFAETGAQAIELVMEIAEHQQAKSVVKSKSMLSEEIGVNEALQKADIESIETDLGEYIIQLAGEMPSHIIIPAIHKNREQVASLLSKEAGETLPPDTAVLAGFARRALREKFIQADIGMTGCNFAIAETGSIVLFENEGNARMVSTLPKTQITLMGMERLLPTWNDLEVMATLLPRSATGQKLTVYMSGITGPRRDQDGDGSEEMHVIIVDNGRSLQLGDPEFQELLNCIRCGACLNACPVYRQIGGHAYGSTYSGPIGAVLKPALNRNVVEWDDIADASSLCGACYEACPVKIPLHDMLVYLRKRKNEQGNKKTFEAIGMKGFRYVMGRHGRLERFLKLARKGQLPFVKDGWIKARVGPLKGWTAYRHFPAVAEQSFRERWPRLQQELQREKGAIRADVKANMEARLRERKREKKSEGKAGGRGLE